jgi:hypothetical protein
MTTLANIATKIADIASQIRREDAALAAYPDEAASISASVASLQKMQRQLQAEYSEAAKRLGYDVCRYRLFSDVGSSRISGVCETLSSFQSLVSTIFDALANGPKERGRLSADIVEKTAFDLGYSFVGSTGFVLTVPNERMLSDEFSSTIDRSIEAVFSVAHAEGPEGVQEYAHTLGHASIRAFRAWVVGHNKHGLGADIRWQRGETVRSQLLVQRQQLEELQRAIDETGAEKTESLTVAGRLVRADVVYKKFRMEVADADDIVGSFSDAIDDEHVAIVPKRYNAYLTKTVRIHYALDEPEVEFFLDRLEPLD